jgi:hypothetical protein
MVDLNEIGRLSTFTDRPFHSRLANQLLLADFLLMDLVGFGTFAPACLASESPIAMACFLLFTVLPDPPDFNWPRFLSCIAFSTFSCAAFEYFAMMI